MRPAACSLAAIGCAAALLAAGGSDAPDATLRGLAGGAAVAAAGLARRFGRRGATTVRKAPVTPPAPRYFIERRYAPRHDVRIPVRLAVNGCSYEALLLSVSARGALLRLQGACGEPLHAAVGQPVRIQDYPAGTLARIGASGAYVEFALRFDPVASPTPPPALAEIASGTDRDL